MAKRRPNKAAFRSGPLLWKAVFFALLLAAWSVLLTAQNPGLMADDSGEMAAAACELGIPHPPGYPLVTLAGRLAVLLPLGSPAFRLNLMASFWTLLSLGLMARLLLRMGRTTPGGKGTAVATLAAVTLVTALLSSRNIFAQSLTAKGGVYTVTMFLAVMLLSLWTTDLERPRVAHFLGASFCWALGMANHWPIVVLWVPFLLYAGLRVPVRRKARFVLRAATLAVLGLSPYLFLPLRAVRHPFLDWGHPADAKQFLWVVTRKLSAGTEPWFRPLADYGRHALEILRVLFLEAWPGLGLLALVGLVLWSRRDRVLFNGTALFLLPVLAAVIVVPRSETTYLLNVYLVPCMVLLAFPAMKGLSAFVHWTRRLGKNVPIVTAAVLLMTAVPVLLMTAQREGRSRYLLQEDYGVNLLRALPRGAFLTGEGDANFFPLYYERVARGTRRDVAMLPLVFFHHRWGWDQAVRQRPPLGSRRPQDLVEALNNLLDDCHDRQETRRFPDGQEIFYTLDTNYLETLKISLMPFFRPMGLVRAVTGREPDPPMLSRLVDGMEAAQRRRGGPPGFQGDSDDVMSHEIVRRYGNQHAVTADWLHYVGRDDLALHHFDRSIVLNPTEERVYTNLASILARSGQWDLCGAVCEEGLKMTGPSAKLYLNLGNARLVQGDYDAAFRAFAQVVRLDPGSDEARSQSQQALTLGRTGAGAAIPRGTPQAMALLSRSLYQEHCPFLSRLASDLVTANRDR